MFKPVARVNRLFGAEGGVALSLYSTFPDDFSIEEPLFANIDSLAVPLFCNRFERRGVTGAWAAFDDLDSVGRVSELLGEELYLRCEEPMQPSSGLDEVVGWSVEAAGCKGRIVDFIEGANPLFEIRFGDREVLVPAVEAYIVAVDGETGCIRMELPDGLLDLN